ncbi:MAG: hypothetical protein ACRD3W_32525, partial [Terriglobales bacterium]
PDGQEVLFYEQPTTIGPRQHLKPTSKTRKTSAKSDDQKKNTQDNTERENTSPFDAWNGWRKSSDSTRGRQVIRQPQSPYKKEPTNQKNTRRTSTTPSTKTDRAGLKRTQNEDSQKPPKEKNSGRPSTFQRAEPKALPEVVLRP